MKSHLTEMQTKIYQLLYTFSGEFLSDLTFKIIKSCGAFRRIDDAKQLGLQRYVTIRNICDSVVH